MSTAMAFLIPVLFHICEILNPFGVVMYCDERSSARSRSSSAAPAASPDPAPAPGLRLRLRLRLCLQYLVLEHQGQQIIAPYQVARIC